MRRKNLLKGLLNKGRNYRYGFNGKEKDLEGMGGGGSTYDYGFRIYNPQLGKFLSVDPLTSSYPYLTPYQFASNTPIMASDIDGLEAVITISQKIGDGTILQVFSEIDASDGTQMSFQNQFPGLPTTGSVNLLVDENYQQIGHNHIPEIEATFSRPKRREGLLHKIERRFTELKGSSSKKDIMEGEDGLKLYSAGLNNTGNALKVASLAAGPAAPIVAGIGEGLTITSDVIDSALDIKNKDAKTATINIGIRVATFGAGKYLDYKLGQFQGLIPKSAGGESVGERAVKVATDIGLDTIENAATDDGR